MITLNIINSINKELLPNLIKRSIQLIMKRFDDITDTMCAGCDRPATVNDLGLCDSCFRKLERDLIRQRDWDYSVTAFLLKDEQRETLRDQVIRDYGAAYELIQAPDIPRKKNKTKPLRSHSTQHKREVAQNAIPDYDSDDVLQAARQFLQAQAETWINFSRLAQYLHEHFYQLNPKRLGRSGKKHKSILKFLTDYPAYFEFQQDTSAKGSYWIRLKD
jgi:hypothetical protein